MSALPAPAPATISVTTDGQKTRERRLSATDGVARVGGSTIRNAKKKENPHKKATGCGGKKNEWTDPTNDGSMTAAAATLDPNDPLYSSGDDSGDNYVLVSGDSQASVRFDPDRSKLQIGPKYTLPEFKRRVDAALDELHSSGDVQESVRAIVELGCPEFSFYVVKRGVSRAIDREARERELTSKMVSHAVLKKLLSARDVANGFERLFEAMEDLVLDAPGAPNVVGDFLVRSVVDEALPPSFLMDRVFGALGGEIVVRARRLLSREHAGSKLERIWGPGDGRTTAELKVVVDQLLGEYVSTGDVAEALRCVAELESHDFGHEIVKRAVTTSLCRDAPTQIKVSLLLGALADEERGCLVSKPQFEKGFKRLRDDLGDLVLDVPNAAAELAGFEARAIAAGILAAAK